jgi:ADP-heptose:LPS heptosyltransferase
MDVNDFEYFVERTGVVIPNVYTPQSFEELCIIINSCKLFIGAASMPLCIANATYVDRIVGLPSDNKDIKLVAGLINHRPNILFEI